MVSILAKRQVAGLPIPNTTDFDSSNKEDDFELKVKSQKKMVESLGKDSTEFQFLGTLISRQGNQIESLKA